MKRIGGKRTLTLTSLAASCALHAGALLALASLYTIADRPAELRFASGGGGLDLEIRWREGPGPGREPAAPVREAPEAPVPAPAPIEQTPPEVAQEVPPPEPAEPLPPAETETAPAALAIAAAALTAPVKAAPSPLPPGPALLAAQAPHAQDRVAPESTPPAGGGAPGAPGERSSARPGASISPRYPESCRRLGHQGTALIECDVSATGLVSRVEVIGSTGCDELDRAAVVALRRAVFMPAIEAGRPVAATVKQPVTFQLRRG